MASVSTMSASDTESIPSATPTNAANTNENNASTPASSSSSSVKRTVVTAKRKEELLLQARAERKQWVRSIPLPFDPDLLSKNHKTNGDATYRLWSSREGLDRFQSSLVFQDKLLQGATSVLSELYGIGDALDDAIEEKDGSDGSNAGEDAYNRRKSLPNRPLSIDNVSDRVSRLVSNTMK